MGVMHLLRCVTKQQPKDRTTTSSPAESHCRDVRQIAKPCDTGTKGWSESHRSHPSPGINIQIHTWTSDRSFPHTHLSASWRRAERRAQSAERSLLSSPCVKNPETQGGVRLVAARCHSPLALRGVGSGLICQETGNIHTACSVLP